MTPQPDSPKQPSSPMTNVLWMNAQKRTFKNWINAKFATAGEKCRVDNLDTAFRDGHLLIALVKILSAKNGAAGAAEKNLVPERQNTLRIHFISNVSKAIRYIESFTNEPLLNIGAEDIVDCNQKLTLGLIWQLILRFQLASIAQNCAPSPVSATASPTDQSPQSALDKMQPQSENMSKSSPTSKLSRNSSRKNAARGASVLKDAQKSVLTLVARRIGSGGAKYIAVLGSQSGPPKALASEWSDGRIFCCVVHSYAPESFPLDQVKSNPQNKEDMVHNLNLAFTFAERELEVPSLLVSEDVVEFPDDKSILTYLSCFAGLPEPPASDPVIEEPIAPIAVVVAEEVIAVTSSKNENIRKLQVPDSAVDVEPNEQPPAEKSFSQVILTPERTDAVAKTKCSTISLPDLPQSPAFTSECEIQKSEQARSVASDTENSEKNSPAHVELPASLDSSPRKEPRLLDLSSSKNSETNEISRATITPQNEVGRNHPIIALHALTFQMRSELSGLVASKKNEAEIKFELDCARNKFEDYTREYNSLKTIESKFVIQAAGADNTNLETQGELKKIKSFDFINKCEESADCEKQNFLSSEEYCKQSHQEIENEFNETADDLYAIKRMLDSLTRAALASTCVYASWLILGLLLILFAVRRIVISDLGAQPGDSGSNAGGGAGVFDSKLATGGKPHHQGDL